VLQPSKLLGNYLVDHLTSPGNKGTAAGRTCVQKRIETGRYHLSTGYIFALRVVANLPHNPVLLRR
jgi:hypothetical protein